MKWFKYQLKNKLTVLLVQNKKSPVVSVQMWVRTGSADETKSEAGISHFIEHLLFKGTKNFKVGEIAAVVEGSGGELNAYTSFDQTVFYVTISTNFRHVALQTISEMMGSPLFDPTEIDREREVVLEEIKRGNDSPSRKASQLLFSNAFKSHPYGRPVIGRPEVVASVSPAKIKRYFESRYVPANMFLVISGDFEKSTMMKEVEKHFSDLKNLKVKKSVRIKEIPLRAPRVKLESSDFQDSFAYLAWRIPGAKSKDIPGLDVLSMILGQGDSSRLVRRLRLDEGLVQNVGSGTFTPRDAGLFVISITFKHDRLLRILNIVGQERKRLISELVDPDELQRAITNLQSEQWYSMETVEGLSRRFGSMEDLFKDPSHLDDYMDQLRELTPKKIQALAKKYLKAEKIMVTMTTPGPLGQLEKDIKKWIKEEKAVPANSKIENKKERRLKVLRKISLKGGSSEIEEHTLASGARLIVKASQETPVISARAAAIGGVRIEPSGKAGVAELFSRAWASSTRNRTEVEISSFIEDRAAGLSGSNGRNSSGLAMECLKSFETEMGNLFAEVMTEFQPREEILQREKQMIIESLQSRQDHPPYLAMRAFSQHFYQGHPYAKESLGNKDELIHLTHDDVQTFKNRVITAKNLCFVVGGNVDAALWIDLLERATADLPSGKSLLEEIPLAYPADSNPVIFQSLAREQSHLIVGYPGLSLKDPRRWSLHLLQAILAGQGGRLFIELRDKESLAYSVSPLVFEGIEGGHFGAYIACSPEKVKKAREMIALEFEKLIQEPVPEAELLRAQRFVLGRHDIELQRCSSQVASILYDDIYGLDFRQGLTPMERVFAVTPEDIQSLAQELFSSTPLVSLVGPKNPF